MAGVPASSAVAEARSLAKTVGTGRFAGAVDRQCVLAGRQTKDWGQVGRTKSAALYGSACWTAERPSEGAVR